jgi:hypothetical protein
MRYRLLTSANPKAEKAFEHGYLNLVLHLAPYKVAGYNVCPMAEIAGCWRTCLNTSGRGGVAARSYNPHGVAVPHNQVQIARIRKTRLFVERRKSLRA